MAVVEVLLYVVLVYLLLGVFCLIPLHAAGLRRIDLGTAGAGWWFRLLITPGMIVFWPLLMRRWRRARRTLDPAPGAVHRPITAEGIRLGPETFQPNGGGMVAQ